MTIDLVALMRHAIIEGALARGSTGDNPWVGCVIVDGEGQILGRGHTQGPGEDHAEIAAIHNALGRGHCVEGATLFSTLEPCSFHGRTPACARVIIEHRLGHVVVGMRDPHPRVNGAGLHILREGGVNVTEGVCESDVRRQLGPWVYAQHPQEVVHRTKEMTVAAFSRAYDLDPALVEALLRDSQRGSAG